MMNISCKFENTTYNKCSSKASKCVKVLANHQNGKQRNTYGGHLVFKNEASLKVKYLSATEDIDID